MKGLAKLVRAEIETIENQPRPLWERALRSRGAPCGCGDCLTCELQTFALRALVRKEQQRESRRRDG